MWAIFEAEFKPLTLEQQHHNINIISGTNGWAWLSVSFEQMQQFSKDNEAKSLHIRLNVLFILGAEWTLATFFFSSIHANPARCCPGQPMLMDILLYFKFYFAQIYLIYLDIVIIENITFHPKALSEVQSDYIWGQETCERMKLLSKCKYFISQIPSV